MDRKKRIIIVDDHPIFTQGLKLIINSYEEYEVAGDAENIADALELASEKNPDISIIDLNLGNEDGLDLIKKMKRRFPDMKILVLSMLKESYYAERSLLAGAHGYIMKEETSEMLLQALDTITAGKIWLSRNERNRYIDTLFSDKKKSRDRKPEPLVSQLTDRQILILSHLGKGLSAPQIAGQLKISVKTVEAHKWQLKKKLGCKTAQELLQYAIRWVK